MSVAELMVFHLATAEAGVKQANTPITHVGGKWSDACPTPNSVTPSTIKSSIINTGPFLSFKEKQAKLAGLMSPHFHTPATAVEVKQANTPTTHVGGKWPDACPTPNSVTPAGIKPTINTDAVLSVKEKQAKLAKLLTMHFSTHLSADEDRPASGNPSTRKKFPVVNAGPKITASGTAKNSLSGWAPSPPDRARKPGEILISPLNADNPTLNTLRRRGDLSDAPVNYHWNTERARSCHECNEVFSLTFRRHHCRACGSTVCDSCGPKIYTLTHHFVRDLPHEMVPNDWTGGKERVCSTCATKHTVRDPV